MGISIAGLRELLLEEHGWLRTRLSVHMINIRVWKDDGRAPIAYGGGLPREILFPMTENDLSVIAEDAKATDRFPIEWCREAWDFWRLALWHEVVHQVQDEVLQAWNPGDGHSGHSEPGWSRAIDYFAECVGCQDPARLHEMLGSNDTLRYRPPTAQALSPLP